jgi:hypothetical protein
MVKRAKNIVTAPVISRTVFRSEQLAASKRTTELNFNIACNIPRDCKTDREKFRLVERINKINDLHVCVSPW